MDTVIKEGWLQKRGDYIKNWRPRWCVLKADGSFQGFTQRVTQKPLTTFKILPHTEIIQSDKHHKNAFIIKNILEFNNVPEKMFCAESENERTEWVDAINKVSKLLRKKADSMDTQASSFKTASSTSDTKENEKTMDDFEMLKVLGKGTFGKVVLCKEKNTGETVLIKMLKKDVIGTEDGIVRILTENKLFQKTKHPFLLSLKFSFQTHNQLCLVMEYANGGDLFFYLARDRVFGEERTRFYGAEITLAIQHLHKLGVVYHNLKLESFLLDADGHIKLTDLSLSNEVSYGATTTSLSVLPQYLAPEVLEDTDNSRAGDWWGVGVVMYEMMRGRLPFYSRDQEVLFELILNEEVKFPARLSEVAKALLSGLLQKDPAKRLGGGEKDAEEVKQHSFFKSINFQDLYDRKIPAPFKPEVKSEIKTSNFAAEFTDEDLELTYPHEGHRESTFDPEDVAKYI